METLEQIKAVPALTQIALVKHSRLSVVPLKKGEFEEIVVRTGPNGEIKSAYNLDGSESKNTMQGRGGTVESELTPGSSGEAPRASGSGCAADSGSPPPARCAGSA